MQDYGPPGGAPPPPPPPPPKKKGGKGLMIIGIILLIVGLLLMLMLWPMIGTIDGDTAAEKMLEGEEGTYTVVDDIDDDAWEGIKAMKDNEAAAELAGIDTSMYDNVDGPGTYTYTLKINGMDTQTVAGVEIPMLDYETTKFEKVPTMGGILGIVILIVGVLLLIVGLIKMKKS